MIAAIGTTSYLLLAAMLFTIGAFGLLIRRNPIIMFMCVELMLNAANLTFSRWRRNSVTSTDRRRCSS